MTTRSCTSAGSITNSPEEYLASHVAQLPGGGVVTMTTREFDLDPAQLPPAVATPEKFRFTFDENTRVLKAVLESASDADPATEWHMTTNGRTLMREPRATVLRRDILSHLVHHRAQLGVHLRLLDVPRAYGPTADET